MDYDVLIVGSGPAGQHAAWQAANMGKRAAIIERKPKIGGVGLQTGTIPSKAMREVAYLMSRAGSRGMREASSDTNRHGLLENAVRNKEMVIAQQESVVLQRLLQSGVALLPGEASFIDEHTLGITDSQGKTKQLSAEVIVLASGSRPRRPADIPFDKRVILDSTSVLNLQQLPSRLLVVGGGVIACEFVSIFAALGVQVSVVDSHERLLAYLSADLVQVLERSFLGMNVQFHMNEKVTEIRKENFGVVTCLASGRQLVSDTLLYAMGREPNAATLKLEHAGVAQDTGWISVNENFQTNKSHIYAIGDLIGRPALASTGMEQGRAAVLHAFSSKKQPIASNLPMAIYTIPEVSYVGLTERGVQQLERDYVVGKAYFKDTARGQIIGDLHGILKLIVDVESLQLLGVHIAGEHASELVHIGQLVMNMNGTVQDILSNVFNYPTLAECYKMAALDCMVQINRRQSAD